MAEGLFAGDFLEPTKSWIPPVAWIFLTLCCFTASAAVSSLAVSLLCRHAFDQFSIIKTHSL